MLPSFSSISVAPPWLWIAFSIGITVLLIVDLLIFGRATHKLTRKAALVESVLWITAALAFNLWFSWQYGAELGVEFLTGYLIEKSLSVDNLFVILLVFSSFKIPQQNQHKVLFYGVLGAVVFRALFIIAGAQLLKEFHWVLYVFGALLVITAIKFLVESDKAEDVQGNWSVRLFKKFFPVSDKLHGERFFTKEHGKKVATPLLLALVVIEATDIVFAVDSIPAVFSVTQDAFVAFASNILAVLGLRALYFVLADWASKLRYLKPGLAAVLGFIGIKMLVIDFVKIPSSVSLLVIFAILGTAALGSWYVGRQEGNSR